MAQNGIYDLAMVIPKGFLPESAECRFVRLMLTARRNYRPRSAGTAHTNDATKLCADEYCHEVSGTGGSAIRWRRRSVIYEFIVGYFIDDHSKMGEAADGASKVNNGTA